MKIATTGYTDIYEEVRRRFYVSNDRLFRTDNRGGEVTDSTICVKGVMLPLEEVKGAAPKRKKSKLNKPFTFYEKDNIKMTRKVKGDKWKILIYVDGEIFKQVSLKPSYEGLSVFIRNRKGRVIKKTFAELNIFNGLPSFCLSMV